MEAQIIMLMRVLLFFSGVYSLIMLFFVCIYNTEKTKKNVLTFAKEVFTDLCNKDKVRCIYRFDDTSLCINKREFIATDRCDSITIEKYVLQYRYNNTNSEYIEIQVLVTKKKKEIYYCSTTITIKS